MIDLAPGEQLLWTGRPDRRVRMGRPEWFQVGASVVLLCFAAFWEHGVLTARTTSGARRYPPFFAVWGVVVVVVAVGSATVRVVVQHHRSTTTSYALTTVRAAAEVGRRRYEAPARDPHVAWSRGRTHVTVTWGRPPRRYDRQPEFVRQIMRIPMSPGYVVFSDVADADALIAALGP